MTARNQSVGCNLEANDAFTSRRFLGVGKPTTLSRIYFNAVSTTIAFCILPFRYVVGLGLHAERLGVWHSRDAVARVLLAARLSTLMTTARMVVSTWPRTTITFLDATLHCLCKRPEKDHCDQVEKHYKDIET